MQFRGLENKPITKTFSDFRIEERVPVGFNDITYRLQTACPFGPKGGNVHQTRHRLERNTLAGTFLRCRPESSRS
jgi:hypothetical protein